MASSVSVVIVTYDGWPLLAECLAGLARQVRLADEIVVVDNGSRDGTAPLVRRHAPHVRLVEAATNLGFAAGNNLGIAASRGEIVVLLNNDAVPEPGFLRELVAPFEADERVGAAAATMVFHTAPDVVASAGIDVFANGLALDRGLGLARDELAPRAAVFGASAGAAAYRRAALESVAHDGVFPATFFMYLEDVDLAWRLRLAGWDAVHVAGAVARHRYSASAVEGSARKRRLLARNRLWVLTRCVPRALLARHCHQILAYDSMAAVYAASRGDWAAVAGRIDGLRGLPARLRERHRIQALAVVGADALQGWLRPPPSRHEILRLRELTRRLAGAGESVRTAGAEETFQHFPRSE